MTLLALLSLALGQTPCPAQSKACPKAECTQVQARVVTITQSKGCLVKVESEDEIDMTEAEIIADPAEDQAIPQNGESNKNSIALGFGLGKNTPAKLTLIYKKKDEDKDSGEQITAQFYVFGPVITRCQTTSTKECKDGKAEETCPAAGKCPAEAKSAGKAVIVVQAYSEKCDECPAAKAAAAAKCDKCPGAKAATVKVTVTKCDECPAAKAAAAKCDQCPATKATAAKVTVTKCDECPAAKAAAAKCDQCPATKATAAKVAVTKCDECPAAKTSACAHCESTKVATAKCNQCPSAKASAHCDQCESAIGTGDCAICKNCQGDEATPSCHPAGEIVQVQAVSTTVPAKVESKTPNKRRGLIRRR